MKVKKDKKRSWKQKIKNMPPFFIVIILVVVILLAILYYLFLHFSPEQILPYEGYAVSGKEITQNLLNSEELNSSNAISAIKVEEQEYLFKKLNKYYVGESQKQEINMEYPIYINNKIALYNLSEDMLLIDSEFKEFDGYPRMTITDGALYNADDLQRADKNEYLFAKNEDGIFINLKEMIITTRENTYTLPMNSLVYFTETYVAYYQIEGESFYYHKIQDIEFGSAVEMNGETITYGELLEKLGISQKETEEEILQEEETVEETEQEETQEEQSKEEETEKNEQKNTTTQTVQNNGQTVTQNNQQTTIENSEQTTVENNEQSTENNQTEENENNANPPEEVLYIKPQVTAENFTAGVYTIKNAVTIEDVQGNIISGVSFTVKSGSKTYARKTIYQTGELTISGLEPNQTYQIEGSYIYINEEGQKIQNNFFKQEIQTLGMESLDSIKLEYENGEIYSNKIELTNMKVGQDLTSESLLAVKKVEIVIDGVSYKVATDKWQQILAGEAVTVQTGETVKSNSTIEYEIKMYDSYGNELVVENNKGVTRTSKTEPKVTIKLQKQDISEIILKLTLSNPDKVDLTNYRYVLTERAGTVVKEGQLTTGDTQLTFTDLDPSKTFLIYIIADYDLEDGKGKRENQVIGEARI